MFELEIGQMPKKVWSEMRTVLEKMRTVSEKKRGLSYGPEFGYGVFELFPEKGPRKKNNFEH